MLSCLTSLADGNDCAMGECREGACTWKKSEFEYVVYPSPWLVSRLTPELLWSSTSNCAQGRRKCASWGTPWQRATLGPRHALRQRDRRLHGAGAATCHFP